MTRVVAVERKHPVSEPRSNVRVIDVRHVSTTVYPSGAWVRVVAFVPKAAA